MHIFIFKFLDRYPYLVGNRYVILTQESVEIFYLLIYYY